MYFQRFLSALQPRLADFLGAVGNSDFFFSTYQSLEYDSYPGPISTKMLPVLPLSAGVDRWLRPWNELARAGMTLREIPKSQPTIRMESCYVLFGIRRIESTMYLWKERELNIEFSSKFANDCNLSSEWCIETEFPATMQALVEASVLCSLNKSPSFFIGVPCSPSRVGAPRGTTTPIAN